MLKYKEYYYTVKVTGYKSRNSHTPIKLYSWFIRDKNGEVLETSETEFDLKKDAIIDAQEHIDEYYY